MINWLARLSIESAPEQSAPYSWTISGEPVEGEWDSTSDGYKIVADVKWV